MQPTRAPLDATPASVRGELVELWRARQLLWAFVWNDLRSRYVGSSIGFFLNLISAMPTSVLPSDVKPSWV